MRKEGRKGVPVQPQARCPVCRFWINTENGEYWDHYALSDKLCKGSRKKVRKEILTKVPPGVKPKVGG